MLVLIAAPMLVVAAPSNPTAVGQERIDRLIGQLGDDDYFVRQWAQEELSRIGLQAFDSLSRAENDDDIEIAERARYLVRMLHVEPVLDGDPPEVKKIFEGYESADEQARISMADQLAKLPNDQGVSALCRLLRFDRSQHVSKLAALKLIDQNAGRHETSPQLRTTVLDSLGRSPRPAAEWLRTWINQRDDATASAAAWARYATDETRVLRQTPHLSRPEIVVGLIEQQVMSLTKLGRDDDALEAMRSLIAMEPEDSTQLTAMFDWLAKQKAWPILEEAIPRYENRFEQEPLLLYGLADSCRKNGNNKLSEEAAHRAVAMHEDNQRLHLGIGYELQRRGMIDWAEWEFRRAIAIGPPGEDATLWVQARLGEMLHDQGRDFDAAKAYEERAAALEERAANGRQPDPSDIKVTRGQMHFFFACDALQKQDLPRQKEELLKGVEADPDNADVLIAMYRYPNDKEMHDLAMTKIRAAGDKFRSKILQSPDDVMAYNQLAWLIANTEGDYQEALRCSLKSIELLPPDSPQRGGYLDTLGHCYFAVGDLENAVKSQTEAVSQEPHSGLIKRQLEKFKKALEDSKNADSKNAESKKG